MKKEYSTSNDVADILCEPCLTTIILCKNSYSKEEQQVIDEMCEQGIDLIFSEIPNSLVLNSEWGKKVFGISQAYTKVTYKGVRFIGNFFIGDMIELPDLEVELTDVDLTQGCKVYSYSLMNYFSKDYEGDVPEFEIGDNEEMPPLIWRHIEGNSLVFVINGNFMDTNAACGILNAVISKSSKVFIYPIINANNLFVLGLPYTSNIASEELIEKYSRDALGIQQDLIFPGILNIATEEKIFPGYYTNDLFEVIENSDDDRISYYLKEIVKQGATLGYITDEGENVSLKPDTEELNISNIENNITSLLNVWNSEFSFESDNKSYINLPIILSTVENTDEDILKTYSAVNSMGYFSNLANINNILEPKTKDDDWVEYEKNLVTMIAYQQDEFGYIENLSVDDTIKRVICFQIMEPQIIYERNRILIRTENFYQEAFFMFKTEYKIESIEGGKYIKVGDKEYLIKQESESMIIYYKEEVE